MRQAEPDREIVRQDRGPRALHGHQSVAPRVGGDRRVLHDDGAGIDRSGQRVEEADLGSERLPQSLSGGPCRSHDMVRPQWLGENLRRAEAVQLVQQGSGRMLRVTDHGGLHRVIPARHGGVDVQLHEPRRQLHPPVLRVRSLKARPDRHEQVRLAAQRPNVGIPGEVADARGIAFGDDPAPVRARQQPRAQAPHEPLHLGDGIGCNHPSAGPHEGPARTGDDRGRAGNLGAVGRAPRHGEVLKPGQLGV